ncbi:MAG: hypothetical protein ACI3YM_03110 [Prevotella sp.]
MKKVLLAALYLMGATCMFVSCSDDDDNNGEEQVVESFSVEYFNELEMLQNHLVEIDSTGARMQNVCGAALDESDTSLLFVGVENIEEAKEMFKGWFPENADLITTGDKMTVNLKDEERKSQGTVYFTAKESGSTVNGLPLFAEVTFAQGTDIKYVSKVYFVSKSSWPENDENQYHVGDYVETFVANGIKRYFGICVKEKSAGQSGMIVGFSTNPEYHFQSCGAFASPSAAKEVSKILRADWNKYKKLFKEECGFELSDSEYFWINKSYFYLFTSGIYAIRLKDGDVDWFDTQWKRPEKRGLYVGYF